MTVERFRYGPKANAGLHYECTDGVPALLPDDKVVDLYTIGQHTRKPLEVIRLHHTYLHSSPVISVTYAEPTHDDKGRDTTWNCTFIIRLSDLTDALAKALRPFFHDTSNPLEVLKLGPLTLQSHSSATEH